MVGSYRNKYEYDAGDSGYGGFALVPNQYLKGIKNLNLAKSSLRYLCASYSPLSEIDLREMSELEFVELLYCGNLAKFSLGSHPKLERLCIEDCNLEALDISGCPGLRDLRSALNNYNSINWGTTGSNLWHICVRNAAFTVALPPFTQFPALRELLISNDNQTGAFVINNPGIVEIQAYENKYSSADVSGCSSLQKLSLSGNPLTSLSLGTADVIKYVALKDCNLTQSLVDYVLQTIDQKNIESGELDLTGNAAPSTAGIAHAQNLRTKRWTVNISTGPASLESWHSVPPRVIVNSSEIKIHLYENLEKWDSEIYSLNGTRLSQKAVHGDVLVYDISAYQPGIYILHFSKGNRRKIIKFMKP
jgi:hypothetical protein